MPRRLLLAAAIVVAAALFSVAPSAVGAQAATSTPTPTPLIGVPGKFGQAPTLTPTPVRSPTSTARASATPPATATRTVTPPTATRSPAAAASPTATRAATATPAATATTASPSASATPIPTFAIAGQPLAGLTIALDPGHGGRDPGALYNGLRESDVNLATALQARALLQLAGARVVLTRDRDVLVGPADGTITQDLEARARMANRTGAQVFVSVHANVHADPEVAGAITFYGVEDGYAGSQRRAARQVELSRQLADAIQRGIVARSGEVDRGVRPANFWVLGATTMPSVLLEAGFLTNAAEARNLGDTRFRQRIAEGIAAGLIDYVRTRQDLPTDRAPAMAGHPAAIYFDATGHNLAFGFRSFFDTRGGLDIFGYPRTEEIQEDGWTVQYFQRARFEFHPEHAGTPYEVQLGLLGDAVTTPRRPFPAGTPFTSTAEHRWYPETGHGLHFGFLTYFDTRGGLDVFGYPISEELPEANDDGSGRVYTVQYFQRARFEYHPEHAGTPYEVQPGLLGDQVLWQKGWLR